MRFRDGEAGERVFKYGKDRKIFNERACSNIKTTYRILID